MQQQHAILQPIWHQIQTNGSSPAVVYEEVTYSYQWLGEEILRISEILRAANIGPGSVVAIATDRHAKLLPCVLSTLMVGATYLPIDPEWPAARLAYVFRESNCQIGFCCNATQSKVCGENDVHWLNVDTSSTQGATNFKSQIGSPALAAASAYVIYTSGSTGQPKGVMNTTAGLACRLSWMQQHFRLNAQHVVLQKTPLTFDVSVWELFWPLQQGATLVIARPGGHKEPSYLANIIDQHQVTHLHFVPSMLDAFLSFPEANKHCQSIQAVICSGEAMTVELQQTFFRQLPHAELHNLYGPTEAAIDVTHWICQPDWQEPIVPIGFPTAGSNLYVLDDEKRPVPTGQVGELYIGGSQVASGYLERPELTAAAFVPDPFATAVDSRMYRTGDQARYREDGALEFLGRIDYQVKVRGLRIELGEIEYNLEKLAEIDRAVVIVNDSQWQDSRIIAYLKATDKHPSVAQLREALAAQLPLYMLPNFFVFLDEFPVTANGKLDRQSLPLPKLTRPPSGRMPANSLEFEIQRIWGELLNIEEPPCDIPFFELGGTSLDAARFVNEIQDRLGEFIYVVSIFDAPTIGEYATFLGANYPKDILREFPDVKIQTQVDSVSDQLTQAQFEQFEAVIPRVSLHSSKGKPNATAVFILSPPRSGTTLLRVMLASHSGLFAAPELQLLTFNNMSERKAAFGDKYKQWLEGSIRTVMELKGLSAEKAKEYICAAEAAGVTTKAFYADLQLALGDRLLVDKSPHYALDSRALIKAKEDFSEAKFIHLVRNPGTMIQSFVRYHMDQVLYLNPHDFEANRLGELIWTRSHENILEFFNTVDSKNQARIYYEALVQDPHQTLAAAFRQLELEFDPAMLTPYENLEHKMVDGLYKESTPMGDTNFLNYRGIDASRANESIDINIANRLSERTKTLASLLGYEFEASSLQITGNEPRRSRLGGRRQRRIKN